MTEIFYRTRNYDIDRTTFGGQINLSDFETDYRGKDNNYESAIAKRISDDRRFDDQCRKNIEGRNRTKKKLEEIKMLRYENKGYTIEIDLPEGYGHEGYSVECRYQYDKVKEKYSLSMWLLRNDINDRFRIDSQEIDTQYISGTRENIRQNICRIVEQASLSGFFDEYIERYEYTYKCFDRGDTLFEEERLSVANAS